MISRRVFRAKIDILLVPLPDVAVKTSKKMIFTPKIMVVFKANKLYVILYKVKLY